MLPFLLNKKVGDALKAIKKGDNSGFDVLYDCIGRAVYLTAYSILGNEPDAADTVQDVFLKLYRNADRYDPDAEAGATAYVLRIARNCALDRLRKRKDYVDIDTAELAASESGAGSDEAAGRLGALLSTLDGTDRQIVVMKAGNGLKFKDIAAALDMSVDAVKKRYQRAILKIRETEQGGTNENRKKNKKDMR